MTLHLGNTASSRSIALAIKSKFLRSVRKAAGDLLYLRKQEHGFRNGQGGDIAMNPTLFMGDGGQLGFFHPIIWIL